MPMDERDLVLLTAATLAGRPPRASLRRTPSFSTLAVQTPRMDITSFVDDLVHAPTQTDSRGVDLTVAAVHRVADPGSIDFGGGELEAADLEAVGTERRDPDDEYGWWHLDASQYLLSYNESLSAPNDLSFVLQTRDELRAQGTFHPTMHIRSLDAVPLAVGGAGLELKENARVSTLFVP